MTKARSLLRLNEFLIIEERQLKKPKHYWISKLAKIIYSTLHPLGFLIKDWETIIAKANTAINLKKSQNHCFYFPPIRIYNEW